MKPPGNSAIATPSSKAVENAGVELQGSDIGGPPSPGLRRIVIATFVGQVTEWYDYGIYALAAAQIGMHFFPSTDRAGSLLAALAVFGIAFMARPLGGILIGVLGDRLGRKAVLVYSLALMTVSTMAVGFLPGTDVLGLLAPTLLVVARFLQGISAAGEATSAVTYVAESVPPRRKGLFTATLMSGNSAGFLLAVAMIWLLQELLGEAVFDDWGWRLAFLFALPLGLVGLYIRRHLEESPVFVKLRARSALSNTPLHDTFATAGGRVELLQAIGLSALSFIANYLLVAYLPLHLRAIGFTARETSLLGMTATVTLLISYPLMGALSDRIGRRPLLLSACLFFVTLSWPLFGLVHASSILSAALCTCLYALGTSAFISCLGLYCTEYIDKARLMTTYSAGFNISAAIFGGSSLWIFETLVRMTGEPRMPAAYLTGAALISLIALLTIRAPAASHLRIGGKA